MGRGQGSGRVGMADASRRHAEDSLERPAERRLALVAEAAGVGRERLGRFPEEGAGKPHAPVGEIAPDLLVAQGGEPTAIRFRRRVDPRADHLDDQDVGR